MSAPQLNRILYVEDEPDIRAVAKLALEAVGGFTIEACSSGQEALAKCAGFGPELILLDVMMPGMDGPSTFAALRATAEGQAVPIAFMTAKVQPSEITRYTDMGAIGVISKPFDPMTLADTVRGLWTDHHGK
ncbi:MAG TPA: response regulator [Alphaproteobacteria bacterium]|jgi:CheY-like chemotaxis protein